MINSDQIIYLRIGKGTKIIVSILVGLIFVLFTALSIYYVLVNPEPSDDFRLAAIALLPTASLILLGWIVVLKLRGTLDEKDLMEQTARILSAELPQAIARRVYGFHSESDEDFISLTGKENEDLKGIKNLYEGQSIDEISQLLRISANVMVGIPSCIYKFSGKAIPADSLAAGLDMSVQINVKRVEIIYRLSVPESTGDECYHYFESTGRGAKLAGYTVEIIKCEKNGGPALGMQACLEIGDEMLVNSRKRLFLVNDIAVCTAHLIHELAQINTATGKASVRKP